MNKLILSRTILASSIALALAACSSGNDTPDTGGAPGAPGGAAPSGDIIALTASNRLVSFDRDAPGDARNSVAVSGLRSGERLIGIDYRPADGLLYGVSDGGRIYTIDAGTGAATERATLQADAADTSDPFAALNGTEFGVDFNPVADRLRIVSDSGQNLRINVDTGATTTDGALNGGGASAAVTAAAYTNSLAGTGTTTLYVLDAANDVLLTQDPPNDGTLSTPVALGTDASAVNGFDIDAFDNLGYAVFNTAGARTLYRIDLAATGNAATAVGALGVAEDIRGIALRVPQVTVHGLTDDGRLVAFKPLTPNTVDSNTAVTGLMGGETLLGIDVRPSDGMLYGITSAGRIYTIDPASGAATVKSTLSADPADTTSPFAGIAGTEFVVDFNPVADRLRVISNTGQNLRINVDTGATITDGAINQSGATPVVTGGAYTNSFAGTASTSLLNIETGSGALVLQNPPNDGTLTPVGALGLTVVGDAGMDIAGGANGLALAALRTSAGGPTSLYRINLGTGAAAPINGTANPGLSVIGSGLPPLRDVAILLK